MKRLSALLCMLTLLLCGCQGTYHSPSETDSTTGATVASTQVTTASTQAPPTEEFAAWQTDFALRLFIHKAKEGENVLISPLSVYTALALAANGAEGQTLSEMEALLGGDLDTLNAAIAAYLSHLSGGKTLSIANAVWLRDDERLAVRPEYLQSAVDYFGADVFKAPFDATTVSDINHWVSENTDGTIKKALDRLEKDDLICLINALSFDAEWSTAYTGEQQQDAVFHAANGTDRTVTMMYSEESTYLKDGGTVGFIKPYTDGYAFAALLPPEGTTPERYIATLTGEKLKTILNSAEDATVYAALPQFSVNYSTELSEVLKALGIPSAFGVQADFSAMATAGNENLRIGRILHNTHITVDSDGVKASGSTVIVMPPGAAPGISKSYTVTLDRPFVYLIIDTANNIPLFIGTVNDIV